MKILSKALWAILLAFFVSATAPAAEDVVFEDFEKENYGNWTIEGDCFGAAPAKGTLPKQQAVRGFKGKQLVNTFQNGDQTTGTLTSPKFKIDHKYITFLIGGGGHKGTALQLLVDGKVVKSQSGPSSEMLEQKYFDVSDLQGKEAQLRIVDKVSGSWGHVNVDHIVFADTKPKKPKNVWNISKAGGPPFDPYTKPTEYKEPWRPQFHFSPKNEWMNDINALVYLDGVYHMLYQWGKGKRHGGYATSKDLIHWDDKGVALVPVDTFLRDATPNVSGAQVFSGSGILITGKTAKKITGSEKPALVMIYTGTKVGTCIAWSNDEGKTWHNYEKNPVANPTGGADPRDPCVIWHEPTKKWVMAIYERGTTFYSSKDLIEWEKESNLRFGFECPDLVELPLDGDKSKMKWVIYDASGKYLVGCFDGKTFIDENKSKKPMFMNLGPDFYAGQSFYPYNLPEPKYIQIAWMDEWNGGVGERVWNRNATFPVELGLVTRDGKMCVTRTPIPAVKELYTGKPVELKNVKVGAENVLKNIKSKAFDMTMTFDLNGATAKEIIFKVTDYEYRYNIADKAFTYKGQKKNKYGSKGPVPLSPDAKNMLKIRMLVDWSSIEMFSDEGVFTFSHHVGFDPKSDSLSLTAEGGDVKLVDLKLNNIKSIWKKK